MANPLAKVIRYLITGGTVTAGDVQGAIEQLEAITTGLDTLLLDHDVRHATGGADELNVGGLFGVLADQQVPSSHATRHENGGDDEINVAGLSGVLDDEQDAGWLKGAVIDVTGLTTNWTIQFDGTKWIVTNTLTGVTPGVHESTHIEGGSDEIQGELKDPQKAGKIFGAVINIGGLSDKWHLRYDIGTSQWVAQSFYHAADHEQGQPDAIPSLPSSDEKAALVGTDGVPSALNKYVTDLDKANNIDPLLPSINQKAALDSSTSPTSVNPYITLQALNAALSAGQATATFGVTTSRAFIHDQAIDKKGTPITVDTARNTIEASTASGLPTEKPIGLIDRYCTIQTGINPGSSTFASATSDVTVTNNTSILNIASIVGNNGFDRGEITLTAPPPAILQVGDFVAVSGATDSSNNGQYKVYSILGSVIAVTVPMGADQVAAGGLATSIKFKKDQIVVITGTALNNDKFKITKVVGDVLTLYPAPVNETVTPTFKLFQPDGVIIAFGLMFITDGTPHNFNAAPTSIESYQFDGSADHYGPLDKATAKWIIGEQYSIDVFFVNIREDTRTSVVRIDNTDSPYVPTLLNQSISADCSAGNIIINLPAITAAADGVEIEFKTRAVGANTITVNCDAADDIDGLGSLPVITAQYESWVIKASYDAGGNSFWSIK